MSNQLDNEGRTARTVVITGGSRGIGLETARQFQRLGDKVIVTYKNAPPSDSDILLPAQDGGDIKPEKLYPFHCDVNSTKDIDSLFSYTEKEFGACDILVLSAGISDDALLIRMSEEKWSNVIDTNLTSAYKVTHRALPAMIKKRSGRIILISSAVAMTGNPGQTNYAAAKAGLIGFGRSLAREIAGRSITVNIVAPGLTDTDMLAALSKEQLDALASKVPMGRIGTREEVASTVCFLASKQASYITGAVIAVDGGLGMGY